MGNATGMYTVANYFYEGTDPCEKDYEAARKWYEKAAEKDHADSLRMLGVIYEKGYGVSVDTEKAKEYYSRAAELGNKDAQSALERLK